MAFHNQVTLIGNIGKGGVEVMEGANGKWGRASVAVTKRWKKEDGEKGEKTTWINLVFPTHLLDNAVKLVTQGRQVFILGELDIREYEADGQKKTGVDIRVESYQLLGAKPDEKAA